MGSGLAVKSEPVPSQRGDEFSGSQTPQERIVERHRLDRDGYAGVFNHLHFVAWAFRYEFPVFAKTLNNHLHDFLQYVEELLPGYHPT